MLFPQTSLKPLQLHSGEQPTSAREQPHDFERQHLSFPSEASRDTPGASCETERSQGRCRQWQPHRSDRQPRKSHLPSAFGLQEQLCFSSFFFCSLLVKLPFGLIVKMPLMVLQDEEPIFCHVLQPASGEFRGEVRNNEGAMELKLAQMQLRCKSDETVRTGVLEPTRSAYNAVSSTHHVVAGWERRRFLTCRLLSSLGLCHPALDESVKCEGD